MSGRVKFHRRYHPDGSPLYDVLLEVVHGSGLWRDIGTVRQYPGDRDWHAYAMPSTDEVGSRYRTRADAVTALVAARTP